MNELNSLRKIVEKVDELFTDVEAVKEDFDEKISTLKNLVQSLNANEQITKELIEAIEDLKLTIQNNTNIQIETQQKIANTLYEFDKKINKSLNKAIENFEYNANNTIYNIANKFNTLNNALDNAIMKLQKQNEKIQQMLHSNNKQLEEITEQYSDNINNAIDSIKSELQRKEEELNEYFYKIKKNVEKQTQEIAKIANKKMFSVNAIFVIFVMLFGLVVGFFTWGIFLQKITITTMM